MLCFQYNEYGAFIYAFTWLELDLLHVDAGSAWSLQILILLIRHVVNHLIPYQAGMDCQQPAIMDQKSKSLLVNEYNKFGIQIMVINIK